MRLHVVRRLPLILLVIGGCAAEPPAVVDAPEADPEPRGTRPVVSTAVAPVAEDGRRCLPLVAAACGCVWGCSTGTPASGGSYLVQHPRISPDGVKATIEPWCVGGECTDAFHGEILCSAVCAPKPADATCHFDATGACVGAAAL